MVTAVLCVSGVVAAPTDGPAVADEPVSGVVRGAVTADDTDQPLAGICVGFFLAAPPEPTFDPVVQVHTQADGSYEAELPVGSYRVYFEPFLTCRSQTLYVGELYDDTTSVTASTILDIAAGQERNGVDAALARPSRITGMVTADEDGAPLEGICVHVDPEDFVLSTGQAQTGADGRYDIGELMAGSYEVRFRDCTPPVDHLFEMYDDDRTELSGIRVAVGVASTTSGIDAGLAPAGHITGTVDEDGTGRPVPGACVHLTTRGVPGKRWIVAAETGPDGSYDLGGLPAGSHSVSFGDCSNANRFRSESYDDVLSGEAGTWALVEVPAAATVTGIDAGVQPLCGGRYVTADLGRAQVPGAGPDVILGTTGADTIAGLGGDDWVCGRGGDDRIRGGPGADRLIGGQGADFLAGGPWSDMLVGGSGVDECRGGRGPRDEVGSCESVRGVP